MSFGDSQLQQYQSSPWGDVAARAETTERATFIKKTYLHLLAAVLAFCALEAVYFETGVVETMFNTMVGGGNSRGSWLIVIVLFMGVAWLANYWAMSAASVGLQYAGLALYVVAESVIFAPMLFIASSPQFGGHDVIPTAGLITLVMFTGLTVAVFVTGHDFSFLRTALIIGGFAAMGFILCGMLFGFQTGNIFTVAMIVLASGYILYDTSNVMLHYRIGQHVAASLALFASVALLFWYVLRLVMSLQRR
jgi:FtsH-binding integral membrane protein